MVGGSDVYWNDLNNLLLQNGNNVHPFASLDSTRKIFENLDNKVVKKYFPEAIDFDRKDVLTLMKYIYNKKSSDALKIYIEEICGDVDVAHLHIYYGKLTSSILNVLSKRSIPIVQTLHEYKLVCPNYKMFDGRHVCYSCKGNKLFNCFVKKCNRDNRLRSLISTVESYVSLLNGSQSKISKFITVSDFQKCEYVKMGFDEDKLVTVHNFIDTNKYRIANERKGYFVYFGRIEKIKGISVLIKAMKAVVKNRPKAILKIAGTGEYIDTCKQLALDMNLNCIDFLGFKDKLEINDIVAGSIANIVPSIWFETFGLTILEAFAMGVPSIVSDIGGMPELVSDGVDGFVVGPGDSHSLANRMIELYDNDALSKKMGAVGRQKINKLFSQESHYEKLQAIYKEVM